MKTIKYLGIFSGIFGIFLLVGFASASNADVLQPASDIEYSEPVVIHNTLQVMDPGYFPKGVHIGSTEAGVGGVTYFNGTIVNASLDTNGNDVIPVTFGDDVRIDGSVWRGANSGPGDSMPIKLDDDVNVSGDIEVAGTVDGVDVSDENAVYYSADGESTPNLPVPSQNPMPSKVIAGTIDPGTQGYACVFNNWYTDTINLPNQFFSGAKTYSVTATYETNNPSGGINPVYLERVDRDTFMLHWQCGHTTNDFINWMAVGY